MQAFLDVSRAASPVTLHALADRWWLVLLRGVVGVLFGLTAFALPGEALLTLVLVYGAFALADGVLAIAAAISGRGPSGARWWLVLSGVLSLVVGLVAVVSPGTVALFLVYFVSAWAIVLGVMQVVAAIQLRKEIEHEWLLILSGVISVLFGIAMALQPIIAAITLVWLIAAFAIVSGCVYVAWAFRLKAWRDRRNGTSATA